MDDGGASATLRRGARVESVVGGAGRLKHVTLDPETRDVTGLIVAFEGNEWFVPMDAVASAEPDRILLRGAWSEYEARGPFDHDGYRTVDPHAVRRERAQGATHGSAPLLDVDRSAVRVPKPSVPEDEQPVTVKRPYHLKLTEERLRVEEKNERAALVRVSRRMVQRIETIEVPIREERVILELIGARPGDTVMVGEKLLRAGETLELTVATEQVSIAKQRVAIEDVSVRKEIVQREEHIQETLHKEALVVEDPARLAVHIFPPSTSLKEPV